MAKKTTAKRTRTLNDRAREISSQGINIINADGSSKYLGPSKKRAAAKKGK